MVIDSLELKVKSDADLALKSLEKLEKSLGSISGKLKEVFGDNSVTQNAEAIASAFNKISESSKNANTDALKEMNKQFAKASKEATKAKEKIEKATESTTKLPTNNAMPQVGRDTNYSGEARKAIEPLQKLDEEAKKVQTTLSNLKITVKTDALKNTEKKLQEYTDKYNNLVESIEKKRFVNPNYNDPKNLQNQWDQKTLKEYQDKIAELSAEQERLAKSGGFEFDNKKIAKSLDSVVASINKVRGVLSGLESKISSVFGKMASSIKNSVKSLPSLANGFQRIQKASQKLSKSLSKTYKMLKLMVTRTALRAFIKDISTGFTNLVQYSDKFNASISLLWNSMRQFGNSVAAAASPLINALAPALNYIIQLIIKVINVVNQLLSALSGGATWIRAKKLTDDYRKSLDKAGKSASKSLQSFDELNNITTDKGAQTDPKDMFETVPIEKKWKELADWIKGISNKLFDPLKKAWDAIGNYVKKSGEFAFTSIGKLLSDIGKDFLEMWGQERTLNFLKTVLMILGDIFQIIGWITTKIDEAWNFNKNGLHFLEDIRDLAYIFSVGLRKITKRLRDWAKNELDLKPLGTALETFVSSLAIPLNSFMNILDDFFATVVTKLLNWTFGEDSGLTRLLYILSSLNYEIDWNKLEENFHNFFVALEPFAETIGNGLLDFIEDLKNKIVDFINGDTIGKFVDAFSEITSGITSSDIKGAIWGVINAFIALKVINGIFGGIATGIKASSWLMKSGLIEATKGGIALSGAFTGMAGVIGPFIGILAGVAVLFTGCFVSSENFRDSLGNLFVTVVKGLPEMGSCFNDLAKSVGDLFNGLGDVLALFTDLISFVAPIVMQNIDKGIQKLKAFVEVLAGMAKILGWAAQALQGVGDGIVGFVTRDSKKMEEASNHFDNAFKQLGDGFRKGIGGTLSFGAANIPFLSTDYAKKIDETIQGLGDTNEATKELTENTNKYAEALSVVPDRYKGVYVGVHEQHEAIMKDQDALVANWEKYDLPKATADASKQSLENYKSFLGSFNGVFDDSITKQMNSLKESTRVATEGIPTEVLNKQKEMQEAGKLTGDAIGLGTKEGLTQSTDEITNSLLPNWLQGFQTTLSPDAMKNATNGIPTGMNQSWQDFTTQNATDMNEYLQSVSTQYFGQDKWNNIGQTAMKGLLQGFRAQETGIKSFFENLINSISQGFNQMANSMQSTMSSVSSGGGSVPRMQPVHLRANGGFVPNGDLFLANEAGAELVGSFGSKTGVANQDQIIQGIANGVESANAESNALMGTMVNLLQVIADKDLSIGDDAIFNSYQRGASSYNKRTGYAPT